MHRATERRTDPPRRSPCDVLVVDDDRATRDLICDQLAEGGHRVDTATNGAEALERLCATRPDLLIFDLSMPVMDGWELRRRILGDDELADIPAVVLSGERIATKDDLAVAATVQKPIGVDELLELVDRHAAPEDAPGGAPRAQDRTFSARSGDLRDST